MADAAGIEFMLPVGRWKGYGGDTDYQGETLETVTWAAGLLAATQRITVFGTVHAPLFHPLDRGQTVRHRRPYRPGPLRTERRLRLERGRVHHVRRRSARRMTRATSTRRSGWMRSSCAWIGRGRLRLRRPVHPAQQVRAKPKPFGGGRPIMMNAGASPTGQAFAIRNCDALFSMTPQGQAGRVRRACAQREGPGARGRARAGRLYRRRRHLPPDQGARPRTTTGTASSTTPIGRRSIASWRCAATRGSVGRDDFEERRLHQANGMGGVPVTGDPDTVARELADACRGRRARHRAVVCELHRRAAVFLR